jgi:hypothetical protein
MAWIIVMYTCWFHSVPVTEYTCMLTQCEQASKSIQDSVLVSCSDGASQIEVGTGSLGWVLYDTLGSEVASGVGPADGHPELMSSYMSELGGTITFPVGK